VQRDACEAEYKSEIGEGARKTSSGDVLKSLGHKGPDIKWTGAQAVSPWQRSIDWPNERVNALPDSLRFNVDWPLMKPLTVAAAP
jgi:hypothetical protein